VKKLTICGKSKKDIDIVMSGEKVLAIGPHPPTPSPNGEGENGSIICELGMH
jgi:hypothetical protein